MKSYKLLFMSILMPSFVFGINIKLENAIKESNIENTKELLKKEFISKKDKQYYLDLAIEIVKSRRTSLAAPNSNTLRIEGPGEGYIWGSALLLLGGLWLACFTVEKEDFTVLATRLSICATTIFFANKYFKKGKKLGAWFETNANQYDNALVVKRMMLEYY